MFHGYDHKQASMEFQKFTASLLVCMTVSLDDTIMLSKQFISEVRPSSCCVYKLR